MVAELFADGSNYLLSLQCRFYTGEAGLLNNKECTTHWRSVGLLQKLNSKAKVLDDVLFVRSGNIYTSAGISAGIDMALDILEGLRGPLFTHAVARGLVPFYFNFNNLALKATITVLKLIRTAPIAGLSMKVGYKTPAANGIAIRLYPTAQARFCIIFR
jgi:hypothetical protein